MPAPTEEIISKLQDNTLEKLSIKSDYGYGDIEKIITVFEKNKSVIEIDLGGSDIHKNSDTFKNILLAISEHDNLQKIDLGFCKINAKIANILAKIINNIPLKYLNLTCTSFSTEGTIILADFFQNNTSLEWINFHNCSIKDEGVIVMFDNLIKNPNCPIKYLDLSSNNLTQESAKKISEFIESNTTLRHINLSGNHLGSEGVKLIAKALENNQTLTTLDLGPTYFDLVGVHAIANMLQKNNTIKKLSLAQNDVMGKQGLTIIAPSLRSNSSLHEINLWGSKINDDGAILLAKALEANNAIKKVNLKSNKISSAWC